MSAAMLKKMLLDAAAALKAERYQEAQDAGRRVTQFDPNNFQAFMCVGLASFHLQEVCWLYVLCVLLLFLLMILTIAQWEDCEDAFRRAADLKPELPAPWKYLVDLFEAKKDVKSKLEPLQKLVDINLRGKKLKKCQKWVAEVAATAMELKMLAKVCVVLSDVVSNRFNLYLWFVQAFDSWYTLVGEQDGDLAQLSLEKTPNEELPDPLSIWLDLIELLQRPGFDLSECSGSYSMAAISKQFFAVAARTDWAAQTDEISALRVKVDVAIAFFMRFHLDALKESKAKPALLKTVDLLAVSIVEWFPEAKIPAEFLLLRSEDQDSPIESEKASEIGAWLSDRHPKSPMALVFQAIESLRAGDSIQLLTVCFALLCQARERFVEALAGYSSSSFQECALCIRVQVELASISLASRDVEGCLNRLALSKKVVADKMLSLGSEGPLPDLYSDPKLEFMTATALEYSGDANKALELYRSVMGGGDAALAVQATIAAAELLLRKSQPAEAMTVIAMSGVSELQVCESTSAVLECTRGWLQFQIGGLDEAQTLLETNVGKISPTDAITKGRMLKRLAIVYWHLGGTHQMAKTGCFGHLLQAAKLTPSDAEIFSWLGKWYQEVAKDILRAEKCFLKALSISVVDELAGMALSNLYELQGKYEANVKLWERVTEDQETAPTWALLRLAQHLVTQNDETAVAKMHLVLRNDPVNAQYWVILAHIYQNFDKQVSAQRSYLKAIELGEDGWCVRCELARIEGSLLLFENALERIKPVVTGELLDGEPDVTVATMIYADLLFQQAKYLCSEGLYGNAAVNLNEASRMMKELPSTSPLSGSVEACKLIGDIHCFAFYLSPDNFSSEGSSWVEFISAGRKAYEAAVLLADKRNEVSDGCDVAAAERYYDIGLSYWYEAQALSNMRGIPTSAFLNEAQSDAGSTVSKLKASASTNFKLALRKDPSCSMAWNGLALVSDNFLVKQFAWSRAIQTGTSSDATWANLGMFYLTQADAVPSTAALAQKSFLQLQSMNPSNPSMWNGYGMLARRQANSTVQQRKAIEAFDCALQTGLDLDALLGLSMALLDFGASVDESIINSPEHGNEQAMFYLKKYLERDPFNGRAWHALGVAQHRLGLYTEALGSYDRAGSSSEPPKSLEWNTLMTKLGELSTKSQDAKANEAELLGQLAAQLDPSTDNSAAVKTIVKAQMLYHQSKAGEALDLLQTLLVQDDSQSTQTEAIALVGLSLASLLMDEFTSKATDGAAMCKERLLAAIDRAGPTFTTRDYLNMRVVELHERWVGEDNAYLTRLQALAQATDSANSSTLWTRLALATVDSQNLQVSSCLVEYMRSAAREISSPGNETADRNLLDALLGLFKADSTGVNGLCLNAQKLIRAEPWNPRAYVLAGASVLKRMNFEARQETHDETLRQLIRLLQTGLALAVAAEKEYDAAQLELLSSYCYIELGEQNQAMVISDHALSRVEAGRKNGAMTTSVNTDLLVARLLMMSNPAKALEKYLSIISALSGSTVPSSRLVPILVELGGIYEELQRLDAAIAVWKLVASLTAVKSVGSTEGDDDMSSTTTALSTYSDVAACFLANLRLALIHGKKNNVKPARKHIKVAVTLAEATSDSNSSTVAAVVENVLVN
ncbi:Tetratricopeptide repeat protein 37 [Phytophthora citrophthora]|uniref:Tetratricopeptide repeat protein 37 n=1 Tax=Phytophthora citrophthora TaxID=4793 RepID=A0AAD9LVK9_9STRA|nr:Tetratricopeptide repeat protein 37 [Phytophthora citrophthora]